MERLKLNQWRFSLRILLLVITAAAVLLGMYERMVFAGKSLAGFLCLWMTSWYLEQIRKALGDSGRRWAGPARAAVFLLMLGTGLALLAKLLLSHWGLYSSDWVQNLSAYCYLTAFVALFFWLPRKVIFPDVEPKLGSFQESLATGSLWMALVLGPFSAAVFFIGLSFGFIGEAGPSYAMLCLFSHCMAGILLLIGLFEEVFRGQLSKPAIVGLVYLGLFYAFLLA